MEYTWASIVAVLVVVGIELLWLKTGILTKVTFWVSYVIIVFFQIIVDGWLTKLSAPIVQYNPAKNSGIRIPWDVPIEDYLFGFALIVLTILLWETAGRRHPGPGHASDVPTRRTGTAPTHPR